MPKAKCYGCGETSKTSGVVAWCPNCGWADQVKKDRWMAARPTRNPVLETMRDSFDSGDPWGSAIGWHFAIADVLTEIDPSLVPDAWGFQQSVFGSNTEAYEYEAICDLIKDEGIEPDVLIHAGNVLARYAKLLSLSGYDY